MSLVNTYIKIREGLLVSVLGVRPDQILNPARKSNQVEAPGSDLATEIKLSMNQIKAIAIDQGGNVVDYQMLSGNSIYGKYKNLVSQLGDFDYQRLSTDQEKLAFWINLYNTLVIDAVIQEEIQNSVIESHLGILSFFQKTAYLVNGQRFSLSDIEHGVIRGNRGFPYFPGSHFPILDPRFRAVIPRADPRIHFALNCASKSCPPIGVYSPEGLEFQLDLVTRNFVNQDLILNRVQKTLTISQIFRWYQVDFGRKQNLLNFLIKYLNNPDNKNGWNRNGVQSGSDITAMIGV